MKTIRIKPRRGVELPGIPAAGADVPVALAEEWLNARLVTKDGVSRETSTIPRGKPASPAKEG